jgi:hypothetical protein
LFCHGYQLQAMRQGRRVGGREFGTDVGHMPQLQSPLRFLRSAEQARAEQNGGDSGEDATIGAAA